MSVGKDIFYYYMPINTDAIIGPETLIGSAIGNKYYMHLLRFSIAEPIKVSGPIMASVLIGIS